MTSMLHKVQFKNRKIKFLTQVIYGRTIFYNYFFSIILTWQMNALIISLGCSFQPRAYFKFCYNTRDKGVNFQFNYYQKHYKNYLPTTHLVNQHPHNN